MTDTPEWAELPADQERELLISSVGDDPNLKAAIANAYTMVGTARREYQAEQFEKAQAHFLEALKIADYIMHTLLEQDISVWNGFFLQFAAATRFELSVVLLSNNPDSYQEAVGLLQDARELYEMTGDREAIAETWNALADLYTAIGDVKAARAARTEAIRGLGKRRLRRDIPSDVWIIRHWHRVIILTFRGDQTSAITSFSDSSIFSHFGLARALPVGP